MTQAHEGPDTGSGGGTGQGAFSNMNVSGNTFAGPAAVGVIGSVVQNVETPPAAQAKDGRERAPGQRLTVAVLVALDEEFRQYQTVFRKDSTVEAGKDGAANHVKHFTWSNARPVTVISRVIGRMGPEHASAAATRFLADSSPDFMVSIGISGALSPDLRLGDIVIGETITGYLANSKIRDGADTLSFEIVPAPQSYRADKQLCDRAAGLETEAPAIYENWRLGAAAVRQRVLPPAEASSIQVIRGSLAAGPSVISSGAFKAWLLAQKRDYLAVDMESSAVAAAVWEDTLKHVKLLVIRGISDLADASKSQLEQETKGQVRDTAMICATRYLEAVLHHVATYR